MGAPPIDVVTDDQQELNTAPADRTDLAVGMDGLSLLDVKTAMNITAADKEKKWCDHCEVNHWSTTKCPWLLKQESHGGASKEKPGAPTGKGKALPGNLPPATKNLLLEKMSPTTATLMAEILSTAGGSFDSAGFTAAVGEALGGAAATSPAVGGMLTSLISAGVIKETAPGQYGLAHTAPSNTVQKSTGGKPKQDLVSKVLKDFAVNAVGEADAAAYAASMAADILAAVGTGDTTPSDHFVEAIAAAGWDKDEAKGVLTALQTAGYLSINDDNTITLTTPGSTAAPEGKPITKADIAAAIKNSGLPDVVQNGIGKALLKALPPGKEVTPASLAFKLKDSYGWPPKAVSTAMVALMQAGILTVGATPDVIKLSGPVDIGSAEGGASADTDNAVPVVVKTDGNALAKSLGLAGSSVGAKALKVLGDADKPLSIPDIIAATGLKNPGYVTPKVQSVLDHLADEGKLNKVPGKGGAPDAYFFGTWEGGQAPGPTPEPSPDPGGAAPAISHADLSTKLKGDIQSAIGNYPDVTPEAIASLTGNLIESFLDSAASGQPIKLQTLLSNDVLQNFASTMDMDPGESDTYLQLAQTVLKTLTDTGLLVGDQLQPIPAATEPTAQQEPTPAPPPPPVDHFDESSPVGSALTKIPGIPAATLTALTNGLKKLKQNPLASPTAGDLFDTMEMTGTTDSEAVGAMLNLDALGIVDLKPNGHIYVSDNKAPTGHCGNNHDTYKTPTPVYCPTCGLSLQPGGSSNPVAPAVTVDPTVMTAVNGINFGSNDPNANPFIAQSLDSLKGQMAQAIQQAFNENGGTKPPADDIIHAVIKTISGPFGANMSALLPVGKLVAKKLTEAGVIGDAPVQQEPTPGPAATSAVVLDEVKQDVTDKVHAYCQTNGVFYDNAALKGLVNDVIANYAASMDDDEVISDVPEAVLQTSIATALLNVIGSVNDATALAAILTPLLAPAVIGNPDPGAGAAPAYDPAKVLDPAAKQKFTDKLKQLGGSIEGKFEPGAFDTFADSVAYAIEESHPGTHPGSLAEGDLTDIIESYLYSVLLDSNSIANTIAATNLANTIAPHFQEMASGVPVGGTIQAPPPVPDNTGAPPAAPGVPIKDAVINQLNELALDVGLSVLPGLDPIAEIHNAAMGFTDDTLADVDDSTLTDIIASALVGIYGLDPDSAGDMDLGAVIEGIKPLIKAYASGETHAHAPASDTEPPPTGPDTINAPPGYPSQPLEKVLGVTSEFNKFLQNDGYAINNDSTSLLVDSLLGEVAAGYGNGALNAEVIQDSLAMKEFLNEVGFDEGSFEHITISVMLSHALENIGVVVNGAPVDPSNPPTAECHNGHHTYKSPVPAACPTCGSPYTPSSAAGTGVLPPPAPLPAGPGTNALPPPAGAGLVATPLAQAYDILGINPGGKGITFLKHLNSNGALGITLTDAVASVPEAPSGTSNINATQAQALIDKALLHGLVSVVPGTYPPKYLFGQFNADKTPRVPDGFTPVPLSKVEHLAVSGTISMATLDVAKTLDSAKGNPVSLQQLLSAAINGGQSPLPVAGAVAELVGAGLALHLPGDYYVLGNLGEPVDKAAIVAKLGGMGVPQEKALDILAKPNMTLQELGKALNYNNAAIGQFLTKLNNLGILEQKPDGTFGLKPTFPPPPPPPDPSKFEPATEAQLLTKSGWNPSGKGITFMKGMAAAGVGGKTIDEILAAWPPGTGKNPPTPSLAQQFVTQGQQWGLVSQVPGTNPPKYAFGKFGGPAVQVPPPISVNIQAPPPPPPDPPLAGVTVAAAPLKRPMGSPSAAPPGVSSVTNDAAYALGFDMHEPGQASAFKASGTYKAIEALQPFSIAGKGLKGKGVSKENLQEMYNAGLLSCEFPDKLFLPGSEWENTYVALKPTRKAGDAPNLPPNSRFIFGTYGSKTVEMDPDVADAVSGWVSLFDPADQPRVQKFLAYMTTSMGTYGTEITAATDLGMSYSDIASLVATIKHKTAPAGTSKPGLLGGVKDKELYLNTAVLMSATGAGNGPKCPKCKVVHRPTTTCPYTAPAVATKSVEDIRAGAPKSFALHGGQVTPSSSATPVTKTPAAALQEAVSKAGVNQGTLGHTILACLHTPTGMNDIDAALTAAGFSHKSKNFLKKCVEQLDIVTQLPDGKYVLKGIGAPGLLVPAPGASSGMVPVSSHQPTNTLGDIQKLYSSDHPIQRMEPQHAQYYHSIVSFLDGVVDTNPAVASVAPALRDNGVYASAAAESLPGYLRQAMFDFTDDWCISQESTAGRLIRDTVSKMGCFFKTPTSGLGGPPPQKTISGAAKNAAAKFGINTSNVGWDSISNATYMVDRDNMNAPMMIEYDSSAFTSPQDCATKVGVDLAHVHAENGKYYVKGPSRAEVILAQQACQLVASKKSGMQEMTLFRGMTDGGFGVVSKMADAHSKSAQQGKAIGAQLYMSGVDSWASGKTVGFGAGLAPDPINDPHTTTSGGITLIKKVPNYYCWAHYSQVMTTPNMTSKASVFRHHPNEQEMLVLAHDSSALTTPGVNKVMKVGFLTTAAEQVQPTGQRPAIAIPEVDLTLPPGFGRYVRTEDQMLWLVTRDSVTVCAMLEWGNPPEPPVDLDIGMETAVTAILKDYAA